jgi:hypothetical protein
MEDPTMRSTMRFPSPGARARAARLLATALWAGALWVASCASPPAPPQWISEAPQGYPPDHYVVGVGSGQTAEEAASRARAEIARKTSGESESVRIAEAWIDEESNVHWALAVLDRTALLDGLSAELAAVEKPMTESLAEADSAPPERALPAVLRAISFAPRRAALLARIANLGGPPSPGEPDLDRARLEERLTELKRLLPIEVEAFEMDSKTGRIGEPLDEVRRAVAQKVIELGFPVGVQNAWGSDPAWLLASSRVAFERLQLHPRDRLVAVHWEAALEITDLKADSQVVAILTEEARATHLNEREARRQAQEDAEAFLATAFADWLSGQTTPN